MVSTVYSLVLVMKKEELTRIRRAASAIFNSKHYKLMSSSMQFKFKQLISILETANNLFKTMEDIPLVDVRIRDQDDDVYAIFKLQHINDISFIASYYVLLYETNDIPKEVIESLKEILYFSVDTIDEIDNVSELEEYSIENSCICNFDELLFKEIILIVEDVTEKPIIGIYKVPEIFAMFKRIWNKHNQEV